jgi:hypothetical protein
MTLVEKDNSTKAQFFKSLPEVIPNLPHRLLLPKVL